MREDVIVVGAGCAGLVAALEARRQGAQVLLIDRGPIGIGTNSALSNGLFAGPTINYSLDNYIEDTLQTGRKLNSEPLVTLLAKESLSAFPFLRSLGIDLVELPKGYRIKSIQSDHAPGFTLVRALMRRVKDSDGIDLFPGFYVIEILKDGEKTYGVKGIDREGRLVSIYAPAVVLATGGAGAIYLRTDNQKNIMGQGYYLAAKAGLRLWDMEFVQFYPLVMAQRGLPSLLLYPPYPEEVLLINSSGEDILNKYNMDLQEAVSTRRGDFSAILFQECLKGPVYMDYRKVPLHRWEKPPLNLLNKVKFNFRKKPITVAPAAHFFMGGVRINEDGQTSLPGLFACGEVVWGLHGANRMSGNALTECVVFGRIAGRNAALYSLSRRGVRQLKVETRLKPSHPLLSHRRKFKEIKTELKSLAWQYAGVLRCEQGLKEGIHKIAQLQQKLSRTEANTTEDRKLKEDLMAATFTVQAVLTASISRKESRGCFIREDFPREDDVNWGKNSCLSYDWERQTFFLNYEPVFT